MTTARIAIICCMACGLLQTLPAAEEPAPIRFELTGATMDGPNLAYTMMRMFMTEEEWQQRVDDCRRRFQTWEKDNGGDMGQFLNDRLVIVALGAAGGEIAEIQKGVAYLALYREFRQPPPSLVLRFLREHKETVTELLASFSWEKASDYVKNKQWREDIARRKARARQEREPDGSHTVASAEPQTSATPEVANVTPKSLEPSATESSQAERSNGDTLKLMSLQWEMFTAPLTAETP